MYRLTVDLLVFALATLLTACTLYPENNNIRAKGSIVNVQDSTPIYLQKPVAGPNLIIDTAWTINGQFSFTGQSYPNGLYELVQKNERPIPVVIGNPTLEIDIDALGNSLVVQGEEKQIANQIYSFVAEYDKECESLTSLQYMSTDSLELRTIDKMEKEARTNFLAKMGRLVIKRPNSYLSLYIISELHSELSSNIQDSIEESLLQWKSPYTEDQLYQNFLKHTK